MNMNKKIFTATSNKHKQEELSALLASLKCEIITPASLPNPPNEPEEGTESYEANSALKALHYSKHTRLICLADDTGLEIDALDGEPGIISARYISPHISFEERNKAVLAKLLHIPYEKRTARFVCVVTLALENKIIRSFRGELEGYITEDIKGKNGFGYDPVFYIPHYKCTLAELPPEDKNQISHRAKACQGAVSFLQDSGLF